MLVPTIQISDEGVIGIGGRLVPLNDRDQWLEAVRPLAAFGPVNLRVSASSDPLLTVCKLLFRQFDCWLSFKAIPDQPTVFSWLDSGAKKLVFSPQEKRPDFLNDGFPESRLIIAETVDELQMDERTVLIDATRIPSAESWANVFCDTLSSDRADGMWPTVVSDPFGVTLGLVYSNRESVVQAVVRGKGVYWSRSRNELWEKGKTSGATSELLKIAADCDNDALQFTVVQRPPGFCHLNRRSCFGDFQDLSTLYNWIAKRAEDPKGYTARLLNDTELLKSKLTEEAGELADADNADEVIWEAADVVYFAMVAMIRSGITFDQVVRELERRTGQLIRRKGDAKKKS